MIRLIASDILPASPRLSRYFLTNPDFLLRVCESQGQSAAEANDKFSLVLHDLRMGGTWKRTNRGRLKQTERALCEQLAGRTRVTVLDLGASDGVTTWEAVHTLRQSLGANVCALLADVNIYMCRYRKGPFVEYRAGDGEPIMARIGRLGLRLSRRRQALRESPDPLATLYLGMTGLRESMQLDARISLIHPLARAEPSITALEMNCLTRHEGLIDSVDAVRASNVLNRGYFRPDQIRAAVSHLHAYLREEGCLVISSNIDVAAGEVEQGTVWRKNGRRFDLIEDFGGGSEVREIVESWESA
jgi:hypothetical protein